MTPPKTIHFMGIGGSGMSAVAQIAHAKNFTVSGCDIQTETPYIDKVTQLGIPVFAGHNVDHLQNIDLLCVTPAAFYQNSDHPEFLAAQRQGKLITWQQFLGQYLHQDKFVICIAGTHGKSTTTAMAGFLLETAGLDPTVEVGATVKDWHSNVRIGQGQYFISEADEFHDNFLYYHPDVIILNNIDLDHPEYFSTFDRMLESYVNFVKNLKPGGTLIYNADSKGNSQLIQKITPLNLNINLIPYSVSEFPQNLTLKIIGGHNQTNAVGVIKLARLLKISAQVTAESLTGFSGLKRRLDLLGEKNNLKVYDDYANHPVSFDANLTALKQQFPRSRICAVIEPHTYSRLRALLPDLPDALKLADQVIVSRIFASRETDPGDFSGADIAAAIGSSAVYIPEFPDIVAYIQSHRTNFDTILIMGSGNSYLLSRQILAAL